MVPLTAARLNSSRSDASAAFAALMRAQSVAIVGASAGHNVQLKLTSRPLKFLKKFGFQGRVYAVNPKYEELDGVRCFPRVTDIPAAVDVAAIFLPKALVLPVLRDCGEKGVKTAVIFSSGFGELGDGGSRDQEALLQVARAYGIRVVGPNASAVANFNSGLVLSFLTAFISCRATAGNIALWSNSGALLSTAIKLTEARGAGLSLLCSNGNESDLNFGDFLSLAVDDPKTDVIAAFLEEVKDGPGVVEALRRAGASGKPVVILKAGVSDRGRKVAASHTGALTGNDRAYSAAFRQLGVVRVRDITDLVDVSILLARYACPPTPEVAIVSVGSGGAAEMMADLCALHGVDLAELSAGLAAKVSSLLTPFSIVVNPIDVTGATSDLNEEHLLYRKLMEFLLSTSSIGIYALVIPYLPYMRQLAEHVEQLLRNTSKPIVPILTGSPEDNQCTEIFRAAGIPYFASPDQGVRALKALQERTAFVRFEQAPSRSPARVATGSAHWVRSELEAIAAQGRRALTFAECAPILQAYGLKVPRYGVARAADEVRKLAVELGFPLAMKIESTSILHKTENDGVRLNIGSQAAAAEAFTDLLENAKPAAGASGLHGVLMQEMVDFHTEVLLGSSSDASLGHFILVGPGGVLVELLPPGALRLPPIDAAQAGEMISETVLGRLLSGYRGRPPGDQEALVEAIVKFSALVSDVGDLVSEIEVNPVFVLGRGRGTRVGDALILLK